MKNVISSSRFRTIRRRILATLAPHFTESDGCYCRETPSGQFHCIEFTSQKRGPGFVVDLGLHLSGTPYFTDVPPYNAFRDRNPGELRATKCCFQMRWRKPDGNQFFRYGGTVEEAEMVVRTVVGGALAALAAMDARWGDGHRLLEEITPSRLLADSQTSAQMWKAGITIEQQRQVSERMFIRPVFPGWSPSIQPVALLLAWLSLKLKRPQLVSEYVEVANHQIPQTGWYTTPGMDAMSQELLKLARDV